MRELLSSMIEVTVGVLFLLVLFALALSPLMWLDKSLCEAKYADHNVEWGVLQGCTIEYKGKQTPVDKIRFLGVE